MYYELIEEKITNRGNIAEASDIKTTKRDSEAYVSLFCFDKSIIDWVEINKTVSGYTGDYYLKTFYFDIDNVDVEKARQDAILLIKRLNNDYGVSPKDLMIYFSGSKGFHLGLHHRLFEEFEHSPGLPDKCKAFAERMAKGIESVDTKIYNKNRIFRLPNSKHLKTGFYKIPLSYYELCNLPLPKIKELAKDVRNFEREKPISELLSNDKLISAFYSAPIPSKTESEVIPVGDRNNTLFNYAVKLTKKSKLSNTDIHDIVGKINRLSTEPLEQNELSQLIGSARRYKKEEVISYNGETFTELIPIFLESLSDKRKKLTTSFDSIDHDMKNKLNGKLIALIGGEGSKKSMLCQYMIVANINRFGIRGAYSSMEMGEVPVMERAINQVCEWEDSSGVERFEKLYKSNPEDVKKELEETAGGFYRDKLIMFFQGGLTPEEYDRMIDTETRKGGKIDILIVDSLGMMGGGEGETERYSEHTRKLKELANKWDLCVILICHVNKECSPELRDSSYYVRGSRKILDNADCYICLSQCVDVTKGSSENPEFFNNKVYVYFYNKRGSGKRIKFIADFNEKRFSIKETTEDPNDYETKNTNAF